MAEHVRRGTAAGGVVLPHAAHGTQTAAQAQRADARTPRRPLLPRPDHHSLRAHELRQSSHVQVSK